MPPDSSDGKPEGPLRKLFTEARRRRVIRTLVLYAGGGAAVVEAADIFTDPLALPDGTVRLLAILAVCGLPVVLALAWAYDVNPTFGDGSPSRGRGPAWGRHTMVVGAFVVSLGAAVALWSRAPSGGDASAGDGGYPLASIAVLPLETVGGDPELQTLATSLHGRLIDGLSRAGATAASVDPGRESLRVISRAGVLPFAGGHVSPDSIARALGVGTIVDGSLTGGPGRVSVRLRLIDPATSRQLDVTEASAEAGDHLALLDAVADSATRLLRKELGYLVRERVRLLETSEPAALEHVLWAEARREEFRRAFARNDLERARRALEDVDSLLAVAERLDPDWVEPVVQRARTAERLMLTAASGSADALDILERALRHAERAVELDPASPTALQVRGSLKALLAAESPPDRSGRLLGEAESDLRAAIRRSFRPTGPLLALSRLVASEGRLEEAHEYGERAYREDPYLEGETLALFRLFEYAFQLGRYADAAEWCRLGFEREPLPMFWDCRLQLMAWSGSVEADPDTAWRLLEGELEGYPAPLRSRLEPRLHGLVAAVLARAGMADSARVLLDRAWSDDPDTGGMLLTAAGTHALLGDEGIALSLVRRYRAEFPDEGRNLARAPELIPLRGDPRFETLVGEIR